MTRRFVMIAIVCAIALAMPSFASAQAKPDFSGKWTQDLEKSDPMPGRAGGGGGGTPTAQTLSITQTAADITIETTRGQNTTKVVYKLDGTESTNPMGRGGDVKSKTTWDGNKLVTKYQRTQGENTIDVTETRSLEADGTLKTVMVNGANPPRTVIFKKG